MELSLLVLRILLGIGIPHGTSASLLSSRQTSATRSNLNETNVEISKAAIQALTPYFSNSTYEWQDVTYWQAANLYDDILDFDYYTGTNTFQSTYGQYLATIIGYPRLISAVGMNDVYNDDDSWWILALLRAYRNYGGDNYLQEAISLWTTITNTSVLTASDEGTAPNKGGLQRNVTIQNGCDVAGAVYWTRYANSGITAIATSLYALTSAILYEITGEQQYLSAATPSLSFLQRNFLNQTTGIMVVDNMNPATCTPAAGDYTYNTGVYIGALTSLWKTTNDQGYYNNASLSATSASTTAFSGSNLLVTEGNDITSNSDLVGFRDILFRNLLDLYVTASSDQTLQGTIAAFVEANFNQIQAHARDGNLYEANWYGEISNGSDWGTLSVMSVLNAAMVML